MRRLLIRVLAMLVLFVPCVVLLIEKRAQSYDQATTHRDLAERSVELIAPQVAPADQATQKYRELGWYKKIIVDADEAEDEGCRSENHFFDPTTGQGVPLNNYTVLYMDGFQRMVVGQSFCGGRGNELPRYRNALDWARDGMPNGDEKLDWEGAIEAYDYTPESKSRAYKAVGHVLHLLQDLGQPDHAKDRPHPCGYINPGSDALFSYETLWAGQRKSWKNGAAPMRVRELDKAFIDLAAESQRAEKSLGLPFPDELSLGCRGIVSINDPNYQIVKAWLLKYAPYFPRLGLIVGGLPGFPEGDRTEDPVFAKFEGWPGLPAIRTIPGPPGDYRTRAYLALGNSLLPEVEEYGAGLLQFFHDIVNQPPYVEEVEIQQKGERKYHKVWFDNLTGDPPHVQSRHAQVEGGELEAGTEAKIVIRIGPKDPDPKGALTVDRKPIVWRKPLKSLTVNLVPDGGRPEDTTAIPVTETGEPASPQGVGVWEGTFTPTRSATLRITGMDAAEHFNDKSAQREQSLTAVGGKHGTQGELDSDPSTPARATWRESKVAGIPSGVPYPWKGYEAGPDTNHHFTVRSVCGPLGQKELEAMRWGTWTGTVMAHALDSKPFPLEAQLSVSFRAAFETARVGSVKRDSAVYDLNSDLQSALSVPGLIRFGRLRGSGTWTELDHSVPGYGKCTLSGTLAPLNVGYMDFDADPQFRSIPQLYVVLNTERPKSPAHGCNGNSVEIQLMEGEVCPNGTWRGKITREDVRRVHDQYRAAKSLQKPFRTISDNFDIRIGWSEAYGWSDLSWSLQFTPSAMPPHVQDLVNFQKWQKAIVAGLVTHGQQLKAELMPILVDLGKSGKLNEWKQLHDALYAQDNPCSSAFAYTTPQSWQDFQAANGMLSQLWLAHWYPTGAGGIGAPEQLSDAELDQQYAEQLKKLEAAVAQFRPVKLSSETKCALETEKLATVIGAVSPNSTSTVQSLRELATKIRKSGIESLGSSNP